MNDTTLIEQLPRHVVIVMDGNGRWAKNRGLPRIAGHKAGVKTIEKIVECAAKRQIEVLTLFAWGIENWGRPKEEVDFIMELFAKTLETQAKHFQKNNIKFRVIGDIEGVQPELQIKIHELEARTHHHSGLILVLAFNYSGRWDILQATKKLCVQSAESRLNPKKISYDDFQNELCLSDLPEPDLFIRTSGELRISNFLLWQLAYTEFYFTDTLFPDFNEESFLKALQSFSQRERRYGLLNCK